MSQTSGEKRRILVGYTPSERGRSALRRALSLAEEADSLLRIASITDPDIGPVEGSHLTAEDLRDAVHDAVGDMPENTEYAVFAFAEHYVDAEYGRAVALSDAASAFAADLIVLGSHDRTKRSGLAGTVTEKMMRYAPCPVLIAAGQERGGYRCALIAVDFSSVSGQLLLTAQKIAPNAETHLLHASSTADEVAVCEGQLRNLLEECGRPELKLHAVVAPPRKAIEQAVADIEPDLLVLGTRGRSVLARIVLGSVAQRFMADPPCDVLAVRSPGAAYEREEMS
jgi:nucleotide-binding universal stress UspA family protein